MGHRGPRQRARATLAQPFSGCQELSRAERGGAGPRARMRAMPRTVGVVTVARSDYGHLVPVLQEIQAVSDLELGVYVAGSHLATRFGRTVTAVETDGWPIVERIEMLLDSDTPGALPAPPRNRGGRLAPAPSLPPPTSPPRPPRRRSRPPGASSRGARSRGASTAAGRPASTGSCGSRDCPG